MHHFAQDSTYHGLCYISRGALAGTMSEGGIDILKLLRSGMAKKKVYRTMCLRSEVGQTLMRIKLSC